MGRGDTENLSEAIVARVSRNESPEMKIPLSRMVPARELMGRINKELHISTEGGDLTVIKFIPKWKGGGGVENGRKRKGEKRKRRGGKRVVAEVLAERGPRGLFH